VAHSKEARTLTLPADLRGRGPVVPLVRAQPPMPSFRKVNASDVYPPRPRRYM
jgi:hypothetical protein